MAQAVISGRRQGQVKWFNDLKGFGFVVVDDLPDIFIHYSAIKMEGFKTLKEGDIVEFDLLESPKGLQALGVITLEHASTSNKEDIAPLDVVIADSQGLDSDRMQAQG